VEELVAAAGAEPVVAAVTDEMVERAVGLDRLRVEKHRAVEAVLRAPAVEEVVDPREPRSARRPLGQDGAEGRVVGVVRGLAGDQDLLFRIFKECLR